MISFGKAEPKQGHVVALVKKSAMLVLMLKHQETTVMLYLVCSSL